MDLEEISYNKLKKITCNWFNNIDYWCSYTGKTYFRNWDRICNYGHHFYLFKKKKLNIYNNKDNNFRESGKNRLFKNYY